LNWENPPSFDTWSKEVKAVGQKGFAVDRGNYINGISVLAVPIVDSQRRIGHALAALGLADTLTASTLRSLAADMQVEAAALAQ